MPKHLKKKSNYRLFSTRPAQARPEVTGAENDDRPGGSTAPDISSGAPDFPSEEIKDLSANDAPCSESIDFSDIELEDVEPTAIAPDGENSPGAAEKAAPAPKRNLPAKKRKPVHTSKKTARWLLAAAVLLAGAAAVVLIAPRLHTAVESPLEPDYVFSPKSISSTEPDKFISSAEVMVNGARTESYTAPDALKIDFGAGGDYTKAEGVIGFRGNNFRSSASFGTADFSSGKFTQSWSADTGTLTDANGNTWSGSGWTGQPLIIKWPDAAREKMSGMYAWAREKSGLVEIIYPTMDGNIYFSELSTGKATRDPMHIGFPFKGTGALDPRGYPILYLGSGADSTEGKSRVFVINLLDCSVMYTFGYYEPFALRGWNMWDASPLVDAKTDQLIYPGENGILYIVHLNTLYDEASGSLTVNPDNMAEWRYSGIRTTTYTYWAGFEASPVCWQGHIIMADNGGNLICLNLNTLKLDWVCDVLDDTNCSPVLSLEKDGAYIYIGGSFHPGWRSETSAKVPIWKINAQSGEVVWETDYTCTGDNGLCGGVQGTIAVGKNSLSGLIFVPVASTPGAKAGVLAALDTKTGREVWSFKTESYSWSSPADVYDGGGNGCLIYPTSDGTMYLLDGKTGKQRDSFNLGSAVEASPAVYDGWAVIGTRGCKIWGVKTG